MDLFVIERLNNLWDEFLFMIKITPAGIYMLKVNNRNTRIKCEICSKLIIMTPHNIY